MFMFLSRVEIESFIFVIICVQIVMNTFKFSQKPKINPFMIKKE